MRLWQIVSVAICAAILPANGAAAGEPIIVQREYCCPSHCTHGCRHCGHGHGLSCAPPQGVVLPTQAIMVAPMMVANMGTVGSLNSFSTQSTDSQMLAFCRQLMASQRNFSNQSQNCEQKSVEERLNDI